MKRRNHFKKWIPLALLSTAFACSSNAAVTDIILAPGAMQPGGDANDTTLHSGTFWNDAGTVTQEFDSSTKSSANIAGSIRVVFDCQGAPGQDPTTIKSANLAFGDYFMTGSGGWLGQPNVLTVDASKYESVSLDINIATGVSSNTTIPFVLYGASYANVSLTNLPITTAGWQHLVIPIPSTINLPDCVAFGIYNWYNTTADTPPAHVEFWMDNIRLVARNAVIPPPTLSLATLPQAGLAFDSGPGEGGARGAVDTVGDVRWTGLVSASSPVTYSMSVGWIPDSKVYSNCEAHIFLAPSAGVGSPDWNLSDMGYLQVVNHNDGTATARMMWKTNEPNGNTMLYATGTLGYLNAPTMLGTWSLSFTSDTDFILRGPGGVSTNMSIPSEWIASFNASGGATYAYFGGGPNGTANAGQPMFLSHVAVTGGANQYALSNDFSSLPLDTTTWALLGNETFIVTPEKGWWVGWTLPAANFTLRGTTDLANPASWVVLSGNTNLPVPVTTYNSGSNAKAFVPAADLPKANATFFALQKLVTAKLQVLMPGETNAPGTATGKIGTPEAQVVGTAVRVTVHAVDANWNIVTYCTDQVNLTSSDTGATSDQGAGLPLTGQLAQGTASFNIMFATAGSQTVTASDSSQSTVSSGTGSSTSVTP